MTSNIPINNVNNFQYQKLIDILADAEPVTPELNIKNDGRYNLLFSYLDQLRTGDAGTLERIGEYLKVKNFKNQYKQKSSDPFDLNDQIGYDSKTCLLSDSTDSIHPEWIEFIFTDLKKLDNKEIVITNDILNDEFIIYILQKFSGQLILLNLKIKIIFDKIVETLDFIIKCKSVSDISIFTLSNWQIDTISGIKKEYITDINGVPKRQFSFRYGKELWQAASYHAKKSAIESFFNQPVITDQYYRKGPDGKLWTKKDGVEAETKLPDEAGADCYGTRINAAECQDFMQKCMIGNPDGIESCKGYMERSEFFNDIRTTIKQMDPNVTKTILERFGFKTFKNVKTGLYEFESITSWLKTVKEAVNTDEFIKIKNNTKLEGFIKMLLEKIAESPAILNNDYISSSVAREVRFKNLSPWAQMIGLKPLVFAPNRRKYNYLNEFIKFPEINKVPLIFRGHPFVIGASPAGLLIGGGDVLPKLLYQPRGDVLYNVYQNMIKNLELQGKTIDPASKKNIEDLFTSFKSAEKKIVGGLAEMNEFINASETFKYNDPDNIFSKENLEQFRDNVKRGVTSMENRGKKVISVIEMVGGKLDGY